MEPQEEHNEAEKGKRNMEKLFDLQVFAQENTQTTGGLSAEMKTYYGMELLDNFRLQDVHMAFVIDEYGEVQGIVTLQDLIEAITGEFQPRDPETSWAVQRDDGSWLLDGHIPVPELKDRLNLASVPEEDRGRYHTLSGMLMFLTGKLPAETDAVQWENWRFEVIDMDGKTIDKVLATRLPEPEIDLSAESVSN